MNKLVSIIVQVVAFILLLQLIGCATTRVNPNKLPQGVKLAKDIKVPTDVAMAIYVPENFLKSQFFLDYGGRVEPGVALRDAVTQVSTQYFPDSRIVNLKADRKFGLLLDLEPEWNFKSGKTIMKLKYRVYDTELKLLHESEKEYKASISYQDPTGSFYNAATRSVQLMYVDILKKLRPVASKYAAVNPVSSIPATLLVNLEEPVSSGTAFNINEKGDLVTAAHVIRSCLVVKAQYQEKLYEVKTKSSSELLDVAVLTSEIQTKDYLSFRMKDKLELGEKVSTVSYPLKGLLDAAPNLTIGNVSSYKALKGSLGLYQFSAPIQPGSSGGAIVSENGEIIGIVNGTLNVESLIEKGVVPQNINFALTPKFITQFLDKNKVSYHRNSKKQSVKNSNEKALASTVQLTCYQ